MMTFMAYATAILFGMIWLDFWCYTVPPFVETYGDRYA